MPDIKVATQEIKRWQPKIQHYMNYYDGQHELSFASDKFKNTFGKTLKAMRDNLCPIVVEAIADRMEVINFSGDKKQTPVSARAWTIWQSNQMEILSNNIHREAIKTGFGYLLVWVNENNEPIFYEQDSRQCALIEDDETGKPLFGAKMWLTDEMRMRLTLYYTDKIEKYVTKETFRKEANEINISNNLKEENFEGYNSDTESELEQNPFGVIPMFKFETFPVLTDCIPIQNALNKTVCDELVSQEFSAFRQRYATGLEPPTNEVTGKAELPFQAGVDRLWFTNDKETKFGEFGVTDLTQYLEVADSYRLEMARVSGTPLHFFSINTSDAISGEALKTLESRFTKRIKRLCLNFGAVWADVMALALQIEGMGGNGELTVQWESPEQRSEKELLESLLLKMQLGVPAKILFEEYGYSIEDIKNFGLVTVPPSGEENGDNGMKE